MRCLDARCIGLFAHVPALHGTTGIEQVDFFFAQQGEECLRFVFAHEELDHHRDVAGQFEEMLLVQSAVATESRHRAERRAALDALLSGAFEQPLVDQDAAVLAGFVGVEPQVDGVHCNAPVTGRLQSGAEQHPHDADAEQRHQQ